MIMTAIVGVRCKKTGKVWIGADAAGVNGDYSIQLRGDPKVFRNGPFVIGYTSSFRMGQLLQHVLIAPKHPANMPDMEYLVCRFIPEVRKVLKDGGFQKTENSQDEGGQFLLAYRGSLYEICSDYQVASPLEGIAAVGAGASVALGAMYALARKMPAQRIEAALRIAAKLNCTVHPPFVVMEA